MTGMGGGSATNNPAIVSAFHQALLHGGMVVFLLVVVLAVVWTSSRRALLRQSQAGSATPQEALVEPAGRRLLRIGFGLLWIFDGVLQGQASMPLGMIPQVVQPASDGSPIWVRHMVNAAASVWNNHPVTAAAATVWIQIGLGLFLLVGGRGQWSRLAGVASAAWGLLVWIFGESFGAIFAPGLTWLFGAPGAAVFYVVAGVLVALPISVWGTDRLGRWLLRALGLFLAGMAVLQAWPGRGFWQGQPPGSSSAGSLTSMVQQMAQTPQPHVLASAVNAFAGFDGAHGWAVNLFAVIATAGVGAALIWQRPGLLRAGVIAGAVLCLADWLLVEDLGFMGGVGTDPNSMIPLLLLLSAGYVAVVRVPSAVPAASARPLTQPAGWRQRLATEPTYRVRAAAAVAAVGVTLVGAAPMAVAATNSSPDTLEAQAIAGGVNTVDYRAAPFQLVDQSGRTVSLAGLRGRAVLLTFLDPVCTSDCPVIASEMKSADHLLGSTASSVAMVAVNANPQYTGVPYLEAFDTQEQLGGVPNWEYLTGDLAQLKQVWRAYGIDVEFGSGGAMVDHSELAFVIDPQGRVRTVIGSDPGPSDSASTSSFAALFADSLRSALKS